jgi:Tol biopolymer transport system component
LVDVYGVDGELVASLDFPPRMRPHNDAWPGWMPDGTALLLQGEFVVPLDGSAPYDLGLGGQAKFSPDGSRVAVMTEAAVRVLDADGSIVAQVNDVEEVAWSTDGERLAFATRQGELGFVDAATGTVTSLPEATAALFGGGDVFIVRGFSPDGERIIYVAGRLGAGGSSDLWSIGVDGSDPRVLVIGVIQGTGRPV